MKQQHSILYESSHKYTAHSHTVKLQRSHNRSYRRALAVFMLSMLATHVRHWCA